jgi:[ribosomal protein S5]-alanine N-acetyltransferase
VVGLRPITAEDAGPLARLLRAERAFLAPFEPERPESFYTPDGQRERIEDLLLRRALGAGYLFAIDRDGDLVGTLSVANVVRGPFGSANLGYWVAQRWNGQGVATAAVGHAVARAFGNLGLHRLEAGTLVDNVASQRVLEKNEFEQIGVARNYLRIAGAWRDHVLYQRTAH